MSFPPQQTPPQDQEHSSALDIFRRLCTIKYIIGALPVVISSIITAANPDVRASSAPALGRLLSPAVKKSRLSVVLGWIVSALRLPKFPVIYAGLLASMGIARYAYRSGFNIRDVAEQAKEDITSIVNGAKELTVCIFRGQIIRASPADFITIVPRLNVPRNVSLKEGIALITYHPSGKMTDPTLSDALVGRTIDGRALVFKDSNTLTASVAAYMGNPFYEARLDPPHLSGVEGNLEYTVDRTGITIRRGNETLGPLPIAGLRANTSLGFGPLRRKVTQTLLPHAPGDSADSDLIRVTANRPAGFTLRPPKDTAASCRYVFSEFVVGRISLDGKRVELCHIGSMERHSIDASLFFSALARYRMADRPSFGIIQAVLGDKCSPAAVSCVMCMAKTGSIPAGWLVDSLPNIQVQLILPNSVPEDATPMSIAAVCNVVYPEGMFGRLAPVVSLNNERHTINERLLAYVNPTTDIPDFELHAKEFASRVARPIPKYTTEQVYRQMNKPSQRANQQQVDTYTGLRIPGPLNMFTKREAVAPGKPARNIVTVPTGRLIHGSEFTLSASEFMKLLPWWIWGLGCGATGRALMDMCRKRTKLKESDFTKFDASLPVCFVALNRLIMHTLFPDHVAEIDKLDDEVFYASGRTQCGIRVPLGHARLSGCNETTLFNTLDQAFIQYVSFRDAGYDADAAWDLLSEGLYGGDDGVTVDVGQDLEGTARKYGMIVKVRRFSTGQHCRLLGRIYPNPWESADSFQDLSEVVAGMHLVELGSEKNVEQGLLNKISGLLVTDPNTPFVKQMCASVLRAYPHLRPGVLDCDVWWLEKLDRSDPFTLDECNDEDWIFAWLAAELRVPVDDIVNLVQWFDANNFHVGSVLPELYPGLLFKPAGCFEICGMPIGDVVDLPAVPKASKRTADEAMKVVKAHMAVLEGSPPARRASKSASELSGSDGSKAGPDGGTCFTCKQHGHFSAQCPTPCRICDQVGHKTSKCEVRCKICNERGHKTSKCTKHAEIAARVELGLRYVAPSSQDSSISGEPAADAAAADVSISAAQAAADMGLVAITNVSDKPSAGSGGGSRRNKGNKRGRGRGKK